MEMLFLRACLITPLTESIVVCSVLWVFILLNLVARISLFFMNYSRLDVHLSIRTGGFFARFLGYFLVPSVLLVHCS